ncbi:transglutaminase-like domain-containing protein [Nocardioides sp. 616]|uniref:transglutaminase-like domain-containing protein n=1 Tax=Nocardioides sp. 616 TaxID=2268090 RepID=UPI000CE4B23E|nr:transglutaminase-like domain-containing protein [Nocardioides sp. 616]
MSAGGTTTRNRVRRDWPRGAQWVDLALLVVLLGLALSGLGSSFTGWGYALVGTLGVLLGVASTLVVRAYRLPLVAAVVLLVAIFFLLGGPLTLRSRGDTAYVPGPGTLGELVDQVLFGWKDMLTTLPPVDGDGPLLVLPWALGLAGGLLGAWVLFVRTSRSWVTAVLPVLVASAVLLVVILVGVQHPSSLLLQGAGFAAVALGWLALRERRESASVRGGRRTPVRAAAGVAVLAVAASAAIPVANAVLGDDAERVVLRDHVTPPFDIGRYPSPLASFRNYVDLKGRKEPLNVHDRELLRVTGAAPGTRIRLAALDAWDGLVYGATNDPLADEGGDGFQRVSSVIDNPMAGDRVEVRVTVGEGYSGVWLPTVGGLQSMRFERGDADGKKETFRYNLATSTAVVPGGVHPGDVYSFEAVLPDDEVTPDSTPSSLVRAPGENTGFLDRVRDKWTEDATTPMARVFAVAKRLRTEGRYSDGVRKAERSYFPGHGLKRLSDGFVNADPMVGNDEQYAAAMALLANKLGVPARVVLGAVLDEDGVVEGRDVQAWVELRVADGSWRTLPTEEFMSDRPPSEQQPQTREPMSGTVVPPPAPVPPPSDLGEAAASDLRARMQQEEKEEKEDEEKSTGLPAWVGFVARYVGLPLLLVGALLGSVIGAKAWRRRRRRSTPATSARFVGAWRELVDHARDLGQPVPLGPTVTRREQSGAIDSARAPALARRADGFVFGPTVPLEDEAADFWAVVDEERRTMSQGVGRRARILAAISPVTLFPGAGRRRRRR